MRARRCLTAFPIYGHIPMREFYAAIIFAVSLLAVTVVVLVFKYGQQHAYTKALEAESAAVHTRANIEMEAARRADAVRRSVEENLEKARQAREMLEKAKASSAMTQKQIIDAMNAQLEREAEAREAAQKASVELIEQRDELARAVGRTRAELQRLRDVKKDTPVPSLEITRLQKLLREREAEIERLKVRQAELERLHLQAVEAQKRTELEIEARGGKVTLAKSRRVISPNLRSGK